MRTLILARSAVSMAVLFFVPASTPQSKPERAIQRPPLMSPPVGGISRFPADCNGNQGHGVNYRNSAVEPYVAVDPRNPQHLVGVWQQDRWSDGGASSGQGSATSIDGGRTWTTSFARFTVCSGGVNQRASDPWSTISPDGVAYQIALTSKTGVGAGVSVSRSADGGFTWGEPTIIHDVVDDDKESITADPNDERYVYAVWDRTGANMSAVAWFSRTTDGGSTWEAARVMYDPGPGSYAFAHQILVLPDGTAVDVFSGGRYNTTDLNFFVLRSQDHGITWSKPVLVAKNAAVGTVNPKTQKPLRTGAGIPMAAVDNVSGAIYVVWEDARFSAFQREGIALAKSLDGGLTWSAPVQVNQATNVQAFTPSVAVGRDGSVAVTYYDFRQDTDDPGTLLAVCWRAVSYDGVRNWREAQVSRPFDVLYAPQTGGQPFLGDYQGLTSSSTGFLAFYVATTGDRANPTSVFADSGERLSDGRSTRRLEINLHPQRGKIQEEPKRRRK